MQTQKYQYTAEDKRDFFFFLRHKVKRTPLQWPPLAKWPKTKTPWRIRTTFCFTTFEGRTFSNYAEFEAEVKRLEEFTDWSWNLDKIAYPRGDIKIQLRYSLQDCGDVLDGIVELKSDNGKFFRSGELFFKLHNAHVKISNGHSGAFTGGTLNREFNRLDVEPASPLYKYGMR